MVDCAGCGERLAVDARFCSDCGLPTRSPNSTSIGHGIGAGGEAEVTVLRGSRADQSAEVTSGSRRFLGYSAALIAVALAWVLFRSPDPAVDDAAAQDDVADESAPADGIGERAAGDDDGSESGGESEGESEAIDRALADPFDERSTVASVELGRGEPVLEGSAIGYSLLAAADGELLQINLDNGEQQQFELAGRAIGVAGDELVLFDEREGFVAVPVDDVDGERRVVFGVPELQGGESRVSVDNLVSAAIREPNTLVAEFIREDIPIGDPTLVFEIEVVGGRFRATPADISDDVSSRLFSTWFGLVWVSGGGLFEAGNEGFRKLSDGFPLMMGLNYAIVNECARPDDCRQAWIERGTGREADRPLPAFENVFWMREIDSEARVLLTDGPEGIALFDVERDRWLGDPGTFGQVGEAATDRFGHVTMALSPDGQWLAVHADNGVVITDLETLTQYHLDPIEDLPDARLFFVENETVG